MKGVYSALLICLVVAGFVCSGCKPSSTAGLEENKALVRRTIEELEKANWAAFVELHAPDFVYHEPGNPKPTTSEDVEQGARMLHAAFPDWRHTIEDMIVEGDKVAVRMTIRGTHKGDFLGVPATGKEVAFTNICIFRIAGGKIAEAWQEIDMMSVMQQIGAIPSDQ